MVARQHQIAARMQALHKPRGLFKLLGRGALREVARHHHHRHPQPLRQSMRSRTHLRVVCAKVQIGQVHEDVHGMVWQRCGE